MDIFVIGFIAVVFVVVIGAFLITILVGLLRWNRNNRSPLLTVPAIVVAKRQEAHGGSGNSSISTRYFVTFQIEGGDRMELPVEGREFGVTMERDRGRLTYQGTRFKGFARAPQDV